MASEAEAVFLQLTIILSLAVASHFVIKRFRQPTIIGEIAIGVILGPSVAVPLLKSWGILPFAAEGLFDPGLIAIFASMGAIFLLFHVGLEMDVKAIYRRKNMVVAAGGVVVPWLLGFLVAYAMLPVSVYADRFVTATFVGATLVATSTAIAAAILLELGKIRTEVATTIMGAVIVDDILGLLVLSLSLGLAGGAFDPVRLATLVAVAVGFIAVTLYLGTRYFARLVVWMHDKAVASGLRNAGFMVAMAFAFSLAFVSELVGLSAVIGAFLAGAMFSGTALRQDFLEGVQFLGAIFTPVFFISLGLFVSVWTLDNSLLLFGALLLPIAFLSKLAGCGLTARAMGMSPKESLAVGYGMIPRGEVGLIIALVAVQQGIIGPNLFSILVIVLLLVSVLPTPLLRRALRSIRPEATSVPAEESSSDPA
jgi:Kef-type K+ transport system membrane component KefB